MKNSEDLLSILNEMAVVDFSISGGECEYVLVKDNEIIRQQLLNVGLEEEYINRYASEGWIDISIIAWEKTDAEYWSSEVGFHKSGESVGIASN